MKINYGPGYQLYFSRREEELILLLVGGDKRRQTEDIRRAQSMVDLPLEDCTDFFEETDNENT